MGKGRKQSGASKLLDLGMDLQSILMNTQDRQQVREMIDKYDDKRREKKRTKESEYLETLNASLGVLFNSCIETSNPMTECLSMLIGAFSSYLDFVESENIKEDRFELMDDENREGIAHYLLEKIEEVREDNHAIQIEIIDKRGGE